MSYEYLYEGSLNYFPCRYGRSRNMFRGPRRDLSLPYNVSVGGIATYGKYTPSPFVHLVETAIGMTNVNLGCLNAGLDMYLKDPEILKIASDAEIVILQIMGAGNSSNRFYSVHPRRNDRFLHATPFLKTIYRDVDFTEFNFTRHMLTVLQETSEDRFETIVNELQGVWLSQMQRFISAMNGHVILLWVGDSSPKASMTRPSMAAEPLLIDADMIRNVRVMARSYIEYIPSASAQNYGTDGMVYSPLEHPIVQNLPNNAMHHEIASLIVQEIHNIKNI